MNKVKEKEALKWGVFRASGGTHVAPCDKYGAIERSHVLSEDCICEPVRELVSDRDDGLAPMYTHNGAH